MNENDHPDRENHGSATTGASIRKFNEARNQALWAHVELAFALARAHEGEIVSAADLAIEHGLTLEAADTVMHLLAGRGFAHRHVEMCLMLMPLEGDDDPDPLEARDLLRVAAERRALKHSEGDGLELGTRCYACNN